jgi:Helix-turn-helix domain
MKPDNGRIMTVRELADYLSAHPTTIYRQLRLGQLPAFKVDEVDPIFETAIARS